MGYKLFAREGYESLQVERMACILNLNISEFYHYLNDREYYLSRLLRHHHQCVDRMIEDVAGIETFDPEYLQVMVDYPLTVMVNRQLGINHRTSFFRKHIRGNQSKNRTGASASLGRLSGHAQSIRCIH